MTAKEAGIHRSTVHLWTLKHPDFARVLLAARHHRADCLLDELDADLAGLALDTFRQILSDGKAPAATRLKAAMEIVKLVEAQRPTFRETTITEVQFDRLDRDLQLHEVAQAVPQAPKAQDVGRNAPCRCGCGKPAPPDLKNKISGNKPGELVQNNHFEPVGFPTGRTNSAIFRPTDPWLELRRSFSTELPSLPRRPASICPSKRTQRPTARHPNQTKPLLNKPGSATGKPLQKIL